MHQGSGPRCGRWWKTWRQRSWSTIRLLNDLSEDEQLADHLRGGMESPATAAEFTTCTRLPELPGDALEDDLLGYAEAREHIAREHYGYLAELAPAGPCVTCSLFCAGRRRSMPTSSPPAGQSCFRSCEAHEESTLLGKRGSVMLFLRGLPQDLTSRELKSYVQAAVRDPNPRAFAFTAAVGNCSILRLTDRTTGASELHGLVEVQPAMAAMRAIEELNGKELKGVAIEVRRYHHRSLLRDRRQDQVPFGNADTVEDADNRRQERRRRNLKIELVGD